MKINNNKKSRKNWVQGLIPVIPATKEAEIERIAVQKQN
jgi:hypothetical protein